MSQVRPIEDLFAELIELDTSEQRQEFLSRVGRDDMALREQLENLVSAHERAGSFLRDEGGEATAAYQHSDLTGTTIGPYKLRERLGAGGMGVVWAAEQKKPLRRKVALKVIKPGMDSEQVIARFEAERAALALMDHRNIARVLDAGTTEQGRPYFVMELIRGVPITEYCDAKRLTVHERLQLFIEVCKAVQHAHQKGIIHRDIKPSNVLITEQDGKAVPKVIDFGVAKALHHPLTDRSIYTGVFQAIGTLAYMSPEQAGLSASDVDTRADVYGLGVLLYELLTGSTPFRKDELASAAFDEACRIIREKDPLKPSTRISTLGDRAAEIGRDRGVDPHGLGKLVRGDLDWVVTRSLEKDRGRRYETADALSGDLQRHLANEPVEARPPSTLYRVGRFYKRNKASVVVGAIICALLIVAIGGTTLGLMRTAATLDRLRVVLEREAMYHAASGKKSKMDEAIEAAMAAGASRRWETRVRGIFALFSGEYGKAIEMLKQCESEGDSSAALYALLSEAHMNRGETGKAIQYMVKAQQLPQQTYEDKLFVSVAVYSNPKAAVGTAEQIFLDEKLPIALLVKSRAQSWLAFEESSVELAKRAVQDAENAMRFMPASNHARSVYLVVLNRAYQIADRENDVGLRDSFRVLGQKQCEEILKNADTFPRLSTVARFFVVIGDDERAEQIYRQAIQRKGDGWARIGWSQYLIGRGKFRDAVDFLKEAKEKEAYLKLQYGLAAGELAGRQEEAKEALRQVVDDDDIVLPYRVWAISHLALLGCASEAEAKARELYDAGLRQQNEILPPFGDILAMQADKITPSIALSRNTRRIDQTDIFFHAAIYELTHGNPQKAREHLQAYRENPWRPGLHDLSHLIEPRIVVTSQSEE